MIKKDSSALQATCSDLEVEVSPERRAYLAQKGKRLYQKYCGTSGCGICAESFAEYHIWRRELIIARDFLVFLCQQIECLRRCPNCTAEIEQQLYITEWLIGRIRGHLGSE